MTMSRWIPPALLPLARRLRPGGLHFEGSYSTWAEAKAKAGGYDQTGILSRIAESTRAVDRGAAAFERDGVLFDEPDYPFHIIAGLLSAKRTAASRLNVLDFGGSLGSIFRQCRPFLGRELTWNVVEQEHYVRIGREEFESLELKFFDRVEAVPAGIDVVLASSVLQYLPDAWQALEAISRTSATRLIVDRTPFAFNQREDKIVIQKVPSHIYRASYACWIFAHSDFLQRLRKDWVLIADYISAEGVYETREGQTFEFRNLILDRRI
jgi:putative methyltransferase (TIGR04325 family)